MNNGDLNCVAKRVVDHFKGALRGQGLTPTPTRRQSKQKWEERVHESGATVEDMAELEKILKSGIILRDNAGEDIYNSGKYGRGGNGGHQPINLIYHNGHAWSKVLHFPQTREVHQTAVVVKHAFILEPVAQCTLVERHITVQEFKVEWGEEAITEDIGGGLVSNCLQYIAFSMFTCLTLILKTPRSTGPE